MLSSMTNWTKPAAQVREIIAITGFRLASPRREKLIALLLNGSTLLLTVDLASSATLSGTSSSNAHYSEAGASPTDIPNGDVAEDKLTLETDPAVITKTAVPGSSFSITSTGSRIFVNPDDKEWNIDGFDHTGGDLPTGGVYSPTTIQNPINAPGAVPLFPGCAFEGAILPSTKSRTLSTVAFDLALEPGESVNYVFDLAYTLGIQQTGKTTASTLGVSMNWALNRGGVELFSGSVEKTDVDRPTVADDPFAGQLPSSCDVFPGTTVTFADFADETGTLTAEATGETFQFIAWVDMYHATFGPGKVEKGTFNWIDSKPITDYLVKSNIGLATFDAILTIPEPSRALLALGGLAPLLLHRRRRNPKALYQALKSPPLASPQLCATVPALPGNPGWDNPNRDPHTCLNHSSKKSGTPTPSAPSATAKPSFSSAPTSSTRSPRPRPSACSATSASR